MSTYYRRTTKNAFSMQSWGSLRSACKIIWIARVSVTLTVSHDTEKRKTSPDHYRSRKTTPTTPTRTGDPNAHTRSDLLPRPAASMQALKATCTMAFSDDAIDSTTHRRHEKNTEAQRKPYEKKQHEKQHDSTQTKERHPNARTRTPGDGPRSPPGFPYELCPETKETDSGHGPHYRGLEDTAHTSVDKTPT